MWFGRQWFQFCRIFSCRSSPTLSPVRQAPVFAWQNWQRRLGAGGEKRIELRMCNKMHARMRTANNQVATPPLFAMCVIMKGAYSLLARGLEYGEKSSGVQLMAAIFDLLSPLCVGVFQRGKRVSYLWCASIRMHDYNSIIMW